MSSEEYPAINEELETTNDELQACNHELRELARRLASERARLLEMVEHAPFKIMVVRGPNLIIEAYNPSFSRIFGSQKVAGQSLYGLATGGDLQQIVELVQQSYHNDVSLTVDGARQRASDDQSKVAEGQFIYTMVPVHEAGGRVDGVVIYAEDVTARVAKEAEQRREQLRVMVENVDHLALALYDATTGELLQASLPFFEVMQGALGTRQHEGIVQTWMELSASGLGEEAAQVFSRVVKEGTPYRWPQFRMKRHREETESIWDIRLAPVSGDDGAVKYVAVAAIETTDQVRAHEELKRLDHMKDVFLSVASHELRTPLTPMKGYADLLARLVAQKEKESNPTWDPRVGLYVERFRSGIQQMQRLVDDLYDVARVESGRFSIDRSDVNLNLLVEKARAEAAMFPPRQEIRIEMPESVRANPVIIKGDEQRLLQVVLNLLRNAATHASESKYIDLRLGRAKGKAIGEEMAMIEVQDYGRGIPPEELDALFTRFYQVSQVGQPGSAGLGLGLFITKAIVEQHGGTVEIQSRVGEGSTFTIRLPCDGEPDEQEQAEPLLVPD